MIWRRKKTQEKRTGHIDVAVDRNGVRYTTRCFGNENDPWHGAIILSPVTIKRLREEGLLPLREVT